MGIAGRVMIDMSPLLKHLSKSQQSACCTPRIANVELVSLCLTHMFHLSLQEADDQLVSASLQKTAVAACAEGRLTLALLALRDGWMDSKTEEDGRGGAGRDGVQKGGGRMCAISKEQGELELGMEIEALGDSSFVGS
eukprot:766742-Hanusia_phi.AAC.6